MSNMTDDNELLKTMAHMTANERAVDARIALKNRNDRIGNTRRRYPAPQDRGMSKAPRPSGGE